MPAKVNYCITLNYLSMSVKFIVCLVLAIVSVVFIIWGSSIKDTRLRVNGKLVYDSDGEEDDARFEKRMRLLYFAHILAFLSGCHYGFWWAIGCVFVAFLMSKMFCYLADRKA